MSGDVAFDEFVALRSPALLRTAYGLVRDLQLAEDLLQTTLTKAWFAWERIEGDPEPYVRRILVTTTISWWRQRWTRETPTDLFADRPANTAVELPVEARELWDAIGRLPRRQRAVVVLRYLEDRTEVDTAHLMNCSVGTVKSQCSKALAEAPLGRGPAAGRGRIRRPRDQQRRGAAMNGDLKYLAEHIASVDGQRPERAAEIGERIRVARRRRTTAAGTAVVGLVLAVVMGGVWANRDLDSGAPQPIKRPGQTKTAEPISDVRKLTYANGSTIHWGDQTIDTGLDLLALYVTDNGVGFTTTDRKVWFTDLEDITQIGDLGDADDGSYKFGFDQRLTLSSGTSGTLFAWYEVANDQQSLVVYDTSDGSEVLRTATVGEFRLGRTDPGGVRRSDVCHVWRPG